MCVCYYLSHWYSRLSALPSLTLPATIPPCSLSSLVPFPFSPSPSPSSHPPASLSLSLPPPPSITTLLTTCTHNHHPSLPPSPHIPSLPLTRSWHTTSPRFEVHVVPHLPNTCHLHLAPALPYTVVLPVFSCALFTDVHW